MSRASELIPPTHNLLHFIGDAHHGDIAVARAAKITGDFTSGKLPQPRLRVQVGDFCDAPADPTMTATAIAWMNGLDSAPWRCAIGNHDITSNITTPDAAAISYGMTGSSYIYDLDFARVIVLGPVPFWDLVGLPQAIGVSQTTLNYLAARLSDAPAGLPCIVVVHAPLKSTVAGGSTVGYPSGSAGFFVYGPNQTDDTEVRAVLNAHANAKLLVCGHTHTQLETAGLFTTVNLGSRSIAHMNCSSPHYTGGLNSAPPTDNYKKLWGAMVSMYVNVFSDRFEIRVRDHGAGAWLGPGGNRVTTIAMPA